MRGHRPRSRRTSDQSHPGADQTGPVRLWPGSPTRAPLVVKATELGRCTVLSSIATATAAITAKSKAAIKLFMTLPLFGRHGAGSARRRRRVALLLFGPNRVALLGPIQTHLAGTHGIERTFHADNPVIEVAKDR